MKQKELLELKILLEEERKRRKRMKEISETEIFQEYCRLIGETPLVLDYTDIIGILKEILKTYVIKQSSGIYICTKAFDKNGFGEYENTMINDEWAIKKEYTDLVTKKIRIAVNYYPELRYDKYRLEEFSKYSLIPEFEQKHIVLNPYNRWCDIEGFYNGYDDVQAEFIDNAIKHGESESKKMLLKKYPRIISQKNKWYYNNMR